SETLEKRDTDLRELSRFHLEVINNIPSGLFTTNTDGLITLFNPAAERITGLGKEEVLGRPITDVFPFLTIPPPLGRIEGGIRTDNGSEIFVGMNISLNRDTSGKTAGFIGTFQDLTSIIRMEKEIKQKEKLAAIGELSASIAHELRNPLASIKSSFEMIREGHLNDETKNRLMEIALTEMDRLNSIVTDFLLYSNPKPPEFSRFDLSRLIKDIVMVAENLKDDIKISISLSEEPLFIKGDQQRIRQLLWNLTTNAVEAIDGAGSVSIGAKNKGSEVLISIKDTGRGIPEDVLPRIFYPFFSTREKGTGLGLAIAYRIVEEHNGNIEVNSRLGEGTEFIIRLPLSEERV
ncbi:MAG: PAS domain S-box protein, partial [Nitrospirae bacterium]